MKALPEALQQLIGEFSKLPGIGRKSATRLAFYVLDTPDQESESLARSILKVNKEIKLCSQCFNFTEKDPCEICGDSNRQQSTICVVEDSQTLLLVEKTNEYKGLYHVLGGIISPLDGVGPEDLHIKELLQRVDGVSEIILALTPSTEGEATSIYLAKLLKLQGKKITLLARGIPLDSSNEFVDEVTLGRSLQARDEV